MPLRTRIALIVLLVSVFYAVISLAKGTTPDLSIFLWSGTISSALLACVLFFLHYGWRMPVLSKLATSTNIRGTWRFEAQIIAREGDIAKIGDYAGFLVIEQTDSDIKIEVLWSDNTRTSLKISAPTAVHDGKIGFCGSYINARGIERSFGAYITPQNETFTLRYCSDAQETGEFRASDQRRRICRSHDVARACHSSPPTRFQRFRFATSWR